VTFSNIGGGPGFFLVVPNALPLVVNSSALPPTTIIIRNTAIAKVILARHASHQMQSTLLGQ
jgi:hypothetical protein